MSAFRSLSGAKRTLSTHRAVIVLGPHHRKARRSTDSGTQGGRTASGGIRSLRESGLAGSAAPVRPVALRPRFVHDVVLARVLHHLLRSGTYGTPRKQPRHDRTVFHRIKGELS